jgi:hypothetical protein
VQRVVDAILSTAPFQSREQLRAPEKALEARWLQHKSACEGAQQAARAPESGYSKKGEHRKQERRCCERAHGAEVLSALQHFCLLGFSTFALASAGSSAALLHFSICGSWVVSSIFAPASRVHRCISAFCSWGRQHFVAFGCAKSYWRCLCCISSRTSQEVRNGTEQRISIMGKAATRSS